MSKFNSSAWATFRNRIFRTSPYNISNEISNFFKSAYNLFSSPSKPNRNGGAFLRRLSTDYSNSDEYTRRRALLRWTILSIFPRKPTPETYQNAYEVERVISDMVVKAEKMLIDGKLPEAKAVLLEALKLAEDTTVFSNISSVYDLLSTIAFKEGGIPEAEDMLVKFIEKLIQLGYPENHNSIIRFKLKLSRLYQSVGNRDMAELGFRDCINTQEEKLMKNKASDELTSLIYVSSLFWYGRFLSEYGEYQKAKAVLKKALNSLASTHSVSAAQVMVVLYYNAEVAYILKEYDDSLIYLYQAINLCKKNDPDNPDLPLYLIKVGYIHIIKGLYEDAKFWCQTAGQMAQMSRNEEAKTEAGLCIETLQKAMKGSINEKQN